MQCPNRDGELITHTTQGENDLAISYSTCATCHGHWMDSFAANFIKLSGNQEGSSIMNLEGLHPTCPICSTQLVRARGQNIPDTVVVYTCASGHGYFFPAGQLAAYKQAQQAKITYHKLWNIPLMSVASVLLAGFLVVISIALSKPQTMTSQAKDILSGHTVIFSQDGSTAMVSATTNAKAEVVLHVPALTLFAVPMKTINGTTHLYTLEHIPNGVYTYTFTVLVGNKKQFTSPPYQFTVSRDGTN